MAQIPDVEYPVESVMDKRSVVKETVSVHLSAVVRTVALQMRFALKGLAVGRTARGGLAEMMAVGEVVERAKAEVIAKKGYASSMDVNLNVKIENVVLTLFVESHVGLVAPRRPVTLTACVC